MNKFICGLLVCACERLAVCVCVIVYDYSSSQFDCSDAKAITVGAAMYYCYVGEQQERVFSISSTVLFKHFPQMVITV